jgi:hypothetical protein
MNSARIIGLAVIVFTRLKDPRPVAFEHLLHCA